MRRRVLRAVAGMPALWLAGLAPARAALPSYRLVDRLSWGVSDAELALATRLGSAGYIALQLDAQAGAELPAEAEAQLAACSSLRQPLLETLVAVEAQRKAAEAVADEEGRNVARDAYTRELNRRVREAAARHLLRALYSRAQLREQMTWFWFNHFSVFQYKSYIRAMLADYEESALRPHALGSFRAMLGAVAQHPAMLRFLDNELNLAGRGNENYARELLELHTLGVDGGYGQRDVQELARVLTGHGINLGEPPALKPDLQPLYVRRGAYEFNPARHDFGDKQILGRTIRGRGAAELDEVLDLLAAHPASARFVCRRIATWMVADQPPAALVERMATAFAGGDIRAALEVLVQDPVFAEGPDKFKDPAHFVLSALRAAYDRRVVLDTAPIQGWLSRLGEGLYNRASPDGYPLVSEAWNGSGQLAARFEVARAIGRDGAGLFKAAENMAPAQAAGFPQLARASYYDARAQARMRAQTRRALESAQTTQDWNALYLSSPEFMMR
ncbi:MAG: DUF1800 domain-containing protein [Rhodocyclaceae bacterium]|nr:DUF1800 domain-containing protein [Rhodocyclaceae bacterium]